MKKRSSWVLYASYTAMIVIAVLLRLTVVAEKHIIKYDDALSYLSATGHDGQYGYIRANNLYPIGEWVQVSQWERFIKIEDGIGFQQIAHDMARSDIHPPLYFWLLYLWLKFMGTDFWTGPLLNIVFDLSTSFVLFLFVFSYSKNSKSAALVSTIWILSPIAIQTSSWARHYSLFTLVGVIFAYLCFNLFYLSKRLTLPTYLLLILTTAAGLLTHFYFIFFILIGVILVGYKALFVNKSKKHFFYLLICVGIASVLFIFIHPEFYLSFISYSPAQPVGSDLGFRIKRTIFINGLLFSPLFLVLSLLILVRFLRTKKLFSIDISDPMMYRNILSQPLTAWVLSYVVLLTAAIIALYLLKISPQHAMGAKYVSFVTPFVALASIIVIWKQPLNLKMTSIICAGMLALGFITMYPVVKDFVGNRLDTSTLRHSDTIVLDNINDGSWPGIMLHLESENEIFAAEQQYLKSHPQNWLPRLSETGGIYISFISRGPGSSNERGREEILDLIQSQNEVSLLSETRKPLGIIRIYKIEPLPTHSTNNF